MCEEKMDTTYRLEEKTEFCEVTSERRWGQNRAATDLIHNQREKSFYSLTPN